MRKMVAARQIEPVWQLPLFCHLSQPTFDRLFWRRRNYVFKKLSQVRNLLGVIMVLSMILSACQTATPAPAPVAPTPQRQLKRLAAHRGAGRASKIQEAPMLKEMVEKGELPPVEDRLPENPLVDSRNRERRQIWRCLAPRFPWTV